MLMSMKVMLVSAEWNVDGDDVGKGRMEMVRKDRDDVDKTRLEVMLRSTEEIEDGNDAG